MVVFKVAAVHSLKGWGQIVQKVISNCRNNWVTDQLLGNLAESSLLALRTSWMSLCWNGLELETSTRMSIRWK